MTIRRHPLILAASLALLTFPLATGCDSDADSLTLEDLSDNLETPANLDIEPTDQPCLTHGAAAGCLDGDSAAFCGAWSSDYAEILFGSCIPFEEVLCVPGELGTVEEWCGEVSATCVASAGVPQWVSQGCEEDGGETPLVLRFDNTPIHMIDAEATPAATFDISMASDQSSCITTDWPTADTPWLAVDLDGSGTIDGGHELFGSGTDLAGGKATNGFLALADYDDNHDGVVDALDSKFAKLLLWRDHDADRFSTPGELEPLSESGVESLSLNYAIDRQCDARGNCGIERAGFMHAGGRGEIVDLHLSCR